MRWPKSKTKYTVPWRDCGIMVSPPSAPALWLLWSCLFASQAPIQNELSCIAVTNFHSAIWRYEWVLRAGTYVHLNPRSDYLPVRTEDRAGGWVGGDSNLLRDSPFQVAILVLETMFFICICQLSFVFVGNLWVTHHSWSLINQEFVGRVWFHFG